MTRTDKLALEVLQSILRFEDALRQDPKSLSTDAIDLLCRSDDTLAPLVTKVSCGVLYPKRSKKPALQLVRS